MPRPTPVSAALKSSRKKKSSCFVDLDLDEYRSSDFLLLVNMPEIVLGEKFSSFESLKDAIERYQKANNVRLIVKDSKLLGRIALSMPKLNVAVNKDIMYYRIAYACEFQGEYKSKGKIKPNYVSKRRGCPMRILLRLAEDLQHLVVYELFEQHNHTLECQPDNNPPRPQTFQMSRLNSSRYKLTRLEEGESGDLFDTEVSFGNEDFDKDPTAIDPDDTRLPKLSAQCASTSHSTKSTSITETQPTVVARLIGNGSKRYLTEDDLQVSTAQLKRRKLMLINRNLELKSRKLKLEMKKLELEVQLLERKHEETNSQQQQQQAYTTQLSADGNTYYISHIIDDTKEGVMAESATFASSSATAAEVIKSLTDSGQPIQIITQ